MIVGCSRGGGGFWVGKCSASISAPGVGGWVGSGWGVSACVVTPILVSDPSPVVLDFMAPTAFVSGAVCVQGGSSAARVPVANVAHK